MTGSIATAERISGMLMQSMKLTIQEKAA